MCRCAGLPGRNTNHSVRRTGCTELLHAGVDPAMVAQYSGHKNINSVNNYAVASINQQKQICSILSRSSNQKPIRPLSKTCTVTPTHVKAAVTWKTLLRKTFKKPLQNSQINNLPSGMFQGANITGGNFNFSFKIQKESSRLRKRVLSIDSSSSDDELEWPDFMWASDVLCNILHRGPKRDNVCR